MSSVQIEEIVALTENLSREEKFEIVERLLVDLKSLEPDATRPKPKRSLLGLCADLGPAPSAEDIDEVRREVWKNFPREDISLTVSRNG